LISTTSDLIRTADAAAGASMAAAVSAAIITGTRTNRRT
jgi:hypothetical protein